MQKLSGDTRGVMTWRSLAPLGLFGHSEARRGRPLRLNERAKHLCFILFEGSSAVVCRRFAARHGFNTLHCQMQTTTPPRVQCVACCRFDRQTCVAKQSEITDS